MEMELHGLFQNSVSQYNKKMEECSSWDYNPRYNQFPFHAINFFVDEHKMVYCIEPMTDNIFWKLSGKPIIVFI